MTETHKKSFTANLFWYSLSSFLPLLIGIFKTSIFTRVFTPLEYGEYTIVFTSMTLFSLFLFSWLSNVLWRYYHHYKTKGELNHFFTTVMTVFTVNTVIFVLGCFVWIQLTNNDNLHHLILLFGIQNILNNIVTYILVIDRIENRSTFFSIITIIRNALSFGILFLMVFAFGMRIESLILSLILIDVPIAIYLLYSFFRQKGFRLVTIRRDDFGKVFWFIPVTITSNVGLVLLSQSDRYIIDYFGGLADVGLYNQAYNLGLLGMGALVGIFFNTVNPQLIYNLENSKDNVNVFFQRNYFIFIVLLLPVAVYSTLYAESLSVILLGAAFRDAWQIIPFVTWSTFIGGFVIFMENKYKFENRNRTVIVFYSITVVFNILTTIALVPLFGYKSAAFTTLISYLLLFVLFHFKQYKLFYQLVIKSKALIVVLLVEVVLHYLINAFINTGTNVIACSVEALVFVALYILVSMRFKEELKNTDSLKL